MGNARVILVTAQQRRKPVVCPTRNLVGSMEIRLSPAVTFTLPVSMENAGDIFYYLELFLRSISVKLKSFQV